MGMLWRLYSPRSIFRHYLQALPEEHTQCFKCTKLVSVAELKTMLMRVKVSFAWNVLVIALVWVSHSGISIHINVVLLRKNVAFVQKKLQLLLLWPHMRLNAMLIVTYQEVGYVRINYKVNAQNMDDDKSTVTDLPKIQNLTLYLNLMFCLYQTPRHHLWLITLTMSDAIATSLNKTNVSHHSPDIAQSAIDDRFKIIRLRTNNRSWDF